MMTMMMVVLDDCGITNVSLATSSSLQWSRKTSVNYLLVLCYMVSKVTI